MRNLLLPILWGCLSFSFILPAATSSSAKNNMVVTDAPATVESTSSLLYNSLQLNDLGLSAEAFDYAWKGYQRLLEKKAITKTEYLTICDFSQPSFQKRLYIINIANQEVVTNTFVAHGKNSGGAYATRFSNKPESLQSSLGFYVTSETYTGKHGLSLRVKGVDPGFNDNALARTIVIHGAAYVDPARAKAGVLMGRSFGCPAVPQKESSKIISTIKHGSCLFIYHPGKAYLNGSKILNG